MASAITGNNAESGRQVTMAAETAEWYINNKLGGFPSLGGRPIKIDILDSTSDASQAALPLERHFLMEIIQLYWKLHSSCALVIFQF